MLRDEKVEFQKKPVKDIVDSSNIFGKIQKHYEDLLGEAITKTEEKMNSQFKDILKEKTEEWEEEKTGLMEKNRQAVAVIQKKNLYEISEKNDEIENLRAINEDLNSTIKSLQMKIEEHNNNQMSMVENLFSGMKKSVDEAVQRVSVAA